MRWGQSSTKDSVFCELTQQVWHHCVHFPADSSYRRILGGFFPWDNSLVQPTSHSSLELDLGASTTTTGEQALLLRGLTATEQRRGADQHPRQALVSTTPLTTPRKRIMSNTSRGNMWRVLILKATLTPKLFHSGYTEMLPHKISSSRPQWITVSHKFIESEKKK